MAASAEFKGVETKKAKLQSDIIPNSLEIECSDSLKNDEDYREAIANLTDFKLVKILFNNTSRKTVCLLGNFKHRSGNAVVILEKTAFTEEEFQESSDHFTEKGCLTRLFQNDVYSNYTYFTTSKLNSLKVTIIHPATDKHIEKYLSHNCYMVEETPELYKEIVLPFLLNEEQLNLQWVYNILDHKAETERIVGEDTDPDIGFVLIPDMKWDESVEALYLLAIVRKHDLKSLRDLTSSHLPLLENIRDKCCKIIEEKYNLDSTQLRIYFHYQPSFYHLHIHFTYLRYEAPGIFTERAHLLSSVINNIRLLPDYYQKATLPFVVHENSKLFKQFESKSVIKKLEVNSK